MEVFAKKRTVTKPNANYLFDPKLRAGEAIGILSPVASTSDARCSANSAQAELFGSLTGSPRERDELAVGHDAIAAKRHASGSVQPRFDEGHSLSGFVQSDLGFAPIA